MQIPVDKRSANFNVPSDLNQFYDNDFLLEIFSKMARVRFFEAGVVDAVNERQLNYPVYLSSGQEAVAAVLSKHLKHHLTFPQHRAHDIFLTWGGAAEQLRDELLGLPGGTSGGAAGSNCLQLHDEEQGIAIFGHHGLIGENVPQAVGAALGSGKPTVCLFGDGAAEEDYVLAAMGFAASQKLPVLFICVDNDLSILTPTEVRRDWKLAEVAKGFGIEAIECADDPRAVAHYLPRLMNKSPALLNVQVCRGFWHAGVGQDGPPAWDRYQMVRDELVDAGFQAEVERAENSARSEMEQVWNRSLSLKKYES